jgi:hypothetical protein
VFASPAISASGLIEEYYINGEMASGLRSSEMEAKHGAEGMGQGSGFRVQALVLLPCSGQTSDRIHNDMSL